MGGHTSPVRACGKYDTQGVRGHDEFVNFKPRSHKAFNEIDTILHIPKKLKMGGTWVETLLGNQPPYLWRGCITGVKTMGTAGLPLPSFHCRFVLSFLLFIYEWLLIILNYRAHTCMLLCLTDFSCHVSVLEDNSKQTSRSFWPGSHFILVSLPWTTTSIFPVSSSIP